jgi:hypothetical protein
VDTQGQTSTNDYSRALKRFIYTAVRDIDFLGKNYAVVMAEVDCVNTGGFVDFCPKPDGS